MQDFWVSSCENEEKLEKVTLGLRPANKRLCYFVMTSLIGWAQA